LSASRRAKPERLSAAASRAEQEVEVERTTTMMLQSPTRSWPFLSS
jgi:hypothetical protein